MYPILYNSSGQKLAVLNNIIEDTASLKRVVNGEFTFSFEAHEEELKSNYFQDENIVVIEDQSFDIKYVELKHSRDVRYHMQCEHVNYRLGDGEENTYQNYIFTGTPTQVLSNILEGTEFSVGVVEFTDAITPTVNGEITKKALIYEIANLLGGEIEYTNGGFTINILNSIGQDNGYQVKFGKNMLGITKFIDRRGDFIVNYAVDIVELKNTEEYISKGLSGLEVIGVGDTIRIIDEVIGLNVQNRIVSKTYNPIKAINTKLEIANKIETINDQIKAIRTETVKTDKLYNNASISNIYGFRAERSDLKAKVEMNATEGFSVFSRSAIENAYAKNLTIDPDGNIVMTGIINIKPGSDTSELGLGDLAYENVVDWDNQLIHIPNALKAPSGDGLYLSSSHLGYYKSGNWRTYMDDEGNFYLGGAAGKLQWNSNLNNLTVNGTITIGPGSVGVSNLSDAGALATKNSVDFSSVDVINKTADYITETIGRKWAAQSGADVTGSNIAAGFSGQGALATLSQISETHITNNAITTPKIAAGAIIASKIFVETLDAISANLGTINAGTINGIVINGTTINGGSVNGTVVTGGTVQTGGSGTSRIVLNSNGLESFNSANQNHGLKLRPSNTTGQFLIYDTNKMMFEITRTIGSNEWMEIRGPSSLDNSTTLILRTNNGAVEVYGSAWDFTTATMKNVNGNVRKVYIQSTAPSDTSGIWIDTST